MDVEKDNIDDSDTVVDEVGKAEDSPTEVETSCETPTDEVNKSGENAVEPPPTETVTAEVNQKVKDTVEPPPEAKLSSPQPSTSNDRRDRSGVNFVNDITAAPSGSSGSESVSTSSGHHDAKQAKRPQTLGIPEESRSFDGLTQRQLLTLAVLAFSDFAAAILLTNQNPWLPIQAYEHGISIGLTGIIFASFELAFLLFFPLLQGKLHRCCVSPQTLFHLGIFTSSASVILFAFLGYVSDWSLFYGFAIVLRFVEGIGQAALISASFAIVALEFPTSLSSAFVSLQTFFGLGLVLGPPLGGALWDAFPSPQRFTLVYGVLGAVAFILAILGLLLLPQSQGDHNHELERHEYTNGFRVVGLLKVNSVPLMGFTVFSTAVSIGFLYVNLSPLLYEFSIHPVLLGGIFLLNGGIGALLAPAFSSLIGLTHRSKLLTIFGAVFIFGGFLLLGPPTFIPLERSPWLISIGLFLHGLGIASLCASTFRFILYQAVKCGYADNIKTYWLVSSLWTMLFCSGLLVGTVSSGFLVDGFGFPTATWLVLDLQILVVIFTLASILSVGMMKYQSSPKRTSYTALDTESEPLLGSPPRGRRSKFSGFHRRSEPRKRVLSDPSSEPKLSPMKTYGGIEDTGNDPSA